MKIVRHKGIRDRECLGAKFATSGISVDDRVFALATMLGRTQHEAGGRSDLATATGQLYGVQEEAKEVTVYSSLTNKGQSKRNIPQLGHPIFHFLFHFLNPPPQ